MKSEFKQQRDAEFYDACRKAIKESSGRILLRDIIKKAILSPASSYFLTERRIGDILRRHPAGDLCCCYVRHDYPKSGSKRLLATRLFERWMNLRAEHNALSAEAAAKTFIAHEPAPRFYISEARGINIYYAELHRRKTRNQTT